MKATGIVRRIDELGRVVIPKEIRRVQHIRSGDSLEIFMEENGEVVFKKYSPLAELGEPAAVYADVLARRLGCGVLVCDREHIVAAAGAGKNELLHRELPPELDRLLKKRRLYTAPTNPDRRIRLGGRWLLCAAPILVHGDIEGGVLLPGSARDPLPEAEVIRAAAAQDYDAFYESEIRMRRLRRYPPFADLFTVTVSGTEEGRVLRAAVSVRETLRQLCRRPELAAGEPEVLGPAPAPVVKVNNRFRYRCTLVGKNDKATREMLAWLQKDFAKDSANRGMNLFVDHNAAD